MQGTHTTPPTTARATAPAPEDIRLHLQGEQTHWLHADEIESLRCTVGSLTLSWQISGIPCQITLDAEDPPWHAAGLAAGTLVCISQHPHGGRRAVALVTPRVQQSWLDQLVQQARQVLGKVGAGSGFRTSSAQTPNA